MATRLLLLTLIGLLLVVPVGSSASDPVASPATGDSLTETVTVVLSETVNPGTFDSRRVLCPLGMVALGGGVDLGNVLNMTVTSSGPTFAPSERLVQMPDGDHPAPIGWQASARNNGPTAKTLKVGVICAPLPDVTTVVLSDTVNPGTFDARRVLCPVGKVAVGGGVDLGNVLTMDVTSSGPTFAPSERLVQMPDGDHPAPIGWQASARNNGATAKTLKVGVICAPLPDVMTVVLSDTVNPGTFDSRRVLCPGDRIAVGGGVDLGNVLNLAVTSSGPTFAPSERLVQVPDGDNPPPIGWQASARNDGPAARALKVGVICAKPPPIYAAFLPLVLKEVETY
jgi:hypothetical protein